MQLVAVSPARKKEKALETWSGYGKIGAVACWFLMLSPNYRLCLAQGGEAFEVAPHICIVGFSGIDNLVAIAPVLKEVFSA